MACFELGRAAVGIRMRIELVHLVDDESAVAGSLKPGIDLVVTRHSGFPLCSEEGKVRVAVMDNTVPITKVSQSVCEEGGRATHHSAISSSSRENGITSDGLCVLASVVVICPMQLSGCGRGRVPHNSGTVDRGSEGR
jgi:hypothetical protein